jgi:hypothetical protein
LQIGQAGKPRQRETQACGHRICTGTVLAHEVFRALPEVLEFIHDR